MDNSCTLSIYVFSSKKWNKNDSNQPNPIPILINVSDQKK